MKDFDFNVVLFNNGEMVGTKNFNDWIEENGSYLEMSETIEECLPIIKKEQMSVEFKNFSSGDWVVVRLEN